MKKNKKLIPKNKCYCYNYLKPMKNGRYKVMGLCPYWSIRKGKPKQNNGYCAYLEKGDWEINAEKRWRQIHNKRGKDTYGKYRSAYEMGFPMSLIWDQVKECKINEEE